VAKAQQIGSSLHFLQHEICLKSNLFIKNLGDRAFIVTARDMSKTERRRYGRKRT
jgi:hypothetical protein